MPPEFLDHIRLVRRDFGNLLFHFTRHLETDTERRNAYSVLRGILSEGRLRGATGFIKGSYPCVCFTEAPITEVAALFRIAGIASMEELRPRYEPYGVAVTKEWLFGKGGRPVIYQPDAEFRLLPEPLRYRHSRFDPTQGVDFTWEREWRVHADSLILDPKETLVVVRSSREAFDLMYNQARWEADFDREGNPMGAWPEPRWLAVSLDFFGLPTAVDIEGM